MYFKKNAKTKFIIHRLSSKRTTNIKQISGEQEMIMKKGLKSKEARQHYTSKR